jgi:hypothetical protein
LAISPLSLAIVVNRKPIRIMRTAYAGSAQ